MADISVAVVHLGIVTVIFQVAVADVGLLRADVSEEAAKDGNRTVFCLAYNSYFNELPSDYTEKASSPLANYSRYDGCGTSYSDIKGKVVAVTRGNCTFFEKAALIQKHGGVAALIIDYSNVSRMSPPGGNGTEYDAINISVAIILHRDFYALSALGENIKVWMYSPHPPTFDPNIVVMFSIATLCVMAGAYFSALHHYHRKQKQVGHVAGGEEDEKDHDIVSLRMGITMSVGLVIFFCLSLTLLYFFYDYLVYMIIAVFCIAGVNGLFYSMLPLWTRLFPCESRLPVSKVPCMSAPPQLRSLGLVFLSCAFVAIWFVFRHDSFAWILQDIIGFCFCIYVMRTLLMPSLRACAILLGLLFIYDIFFVFVTPLLTKDGESIMIKVATGGDSKTGEQMPTVFKLPYFLPWDMSLCFTEKYSLLGYGDVIIPGLLISYNCAFDLRTHNDAQGRWRFVYYTSACIAYMVGLGCTGVALYVMRSGQPALLYLVPCTLITTILIAQWRGDLGFMWRGHECPKKNDDIKPDGSCLKAVGGGDRALHEEITTEDEEDENHSLIR